MRRLPTSVRPWSVRRLFHGHVSKNRCVVGLNTIYLSKVKPYPSNGTIFNCLARLLTWDLGSRFWNSGHLAWHGGPAFYCSNDILVKAIAGSSAVIKMWVPLTNIHMLLTSLLLMLFGVFLKKLSTAVYIVMD